MLDKARELLWILVKASRALPQQNNVALQSRNQKVRGLSRISLTVHLLTGDME